VIFDHHALRSENWREEIRPIYEAGRGVDHTVTTAAEYLGLKPNALESMRQQLYADDPPSESFLKWCALQRDKQTQTPPPA